MSNAVELSVDGPAAVTALHVAGPGPVVDLDVADLTGARA